MVFISLLNRILEKYRWHILIFLLALILLSSLTLPKRFITDEWITMNQLTQIDQGHQIIFNEGKYGAYENGTPYKYFIAKDNRLGYTLFLPLLSLPVLRIMHLCGNLFLYLFLVLWSGILIFLAYFIARYFTDLPEICGISLNNILIIAAFLLFFLNMVFFAPFRFDDPEMPIEVAAIGFTNLILVSLLTVLLFDSYETIFASHQTSISATIISLCCSSFIFWTTSAKDHLLVAFLAGLLVWCGIRYVYTRNFWYIPSFFLIIGLLAWARAEIAVPVVVVFSIIILIKGIAILQKDPKRGFLLIISPLFTLLGALPFFINNYLVTHNPLVPAFIYYQESVSLGFGMVINSTVLPGTAVNPITQTSIPHFINSVFSIYIPTPGTSILDLLKILFMPQSMATAVFVICPLLLLGLIFLIPCGFRGNKFSEKEKRLFLFLGLLSICIILAYTRSWSGMPVSSGIIPDMRYYSPLYIPFSIMGILLLQRCNMFPPVLSKNGMAVILFTATELIVILIAFMIIFRPSDLASGKYLLIVSATSTCCLYALVVLSLLAYRIIKNTLIKIEFTSLLLCAVVTVPLVWQIGMVFISSIMIGSAGYTNWIPIVKIIFQSIQDVIFRGLY
jgi:hypothetical protein